MNARGMPGLLTALAMLLLQFKALVSFNPSTAGVRFVRSNPIQTLMSQRIDSHLHLWSPDGERYPWDIPPPDNLNSNGLATSENFIKLMDGAHVAHAMVVQPINYGQDYKYLIDAMDAYPTRLKGMFLADPTVPTSEASAWIDERAGSHANWVGVRFNPYKWPEDSETGMADDTGKAMFQRAGELGLVVGFMPFKGLCRHTSEIEALLRSASQTQVIIDHWGFFLQPATGTGDDRAVDEESWKCLLALSSFPQVSVKISALFRVAKDQLPFASLSKRLEDLLSAFGSTRLLWGSDFPFVTEHSEYSQAVQAIEQWPVWQELSQVDRENILFKTSARLFKF